MDPSSRVSLPSLNSDGPIEAIYRWIPRRIGSTLPSLNSDGPIEASRRLPSLQVAALLPSLNSDGPIEARSVLRMRDGGCGSLPSLNSDGPIEATNEHSGTGRASLPSVAEQRRPH